MAPKLKVGSRPPWVGLAAAVWVETSAGNAYTFPLYSPSLKSVLGFNQQQLTMLGVANDIGENFGILPGIACNHFPPWMVLLVGAACCFLGYGVLWLAVSQTVSSLPYWLLWIALCIASNSNAWFGTGVIVTNMRNFPLSRGTVSGILKGYVGISAAVYTVIYSLVLNQSASNLLLFLTLGIPVLCIALMYFIRPCIAASGEDSSVHIHFLFTQAASVFLAVYLLSTTILSDIFSLSTSLSYTLIALMVIFLMSPLAIPLKMTLFRANPKKRPPIGSSAYSPLEEKGKEEEDDDEEDEEEEEEKKEQELNQAPPLLTLYSSGSYFGNLYDGEYASEIDILIAEGEGAIIEKKRRPKRGEDFNFRQAFVKADFWLLWLVYFLGVGSGVTVLNNLAQIGAALGVDDTTILLSLFSFFNFLGRLGGGVISEHFVRSKAIPRPVWMTCTQLIMIIAFLLYASALNGTLYIATALLGFCYGVQFTIMVPTSSELFGLKHFGIIFNFMLLGNPVGALLFSGLLAGYVYDAEAAKQGSSTCLGAECFRLTFFILAGVCGLGTFLSIILVIRIKPVYQMLYAGGSFRLPEGSNI